MSESQINFNNIETFINNHLDHLLNDKEFRQSFFNDPKKFLKNPDVNMPPEIISILQKFRCPQISDNVTSFNDKLVLCSSAPS